MADILSSIHWLHHASFRIEAGGKVLYLDPWNVRDTSKKADYIFVSHNHYDHFSIPDIKKISKDPTIVVCTRETADEAEGFEPVVIKPGQKIEFEGISVEAIPAYNINKQFHTKAAGKAGYVITIDGARIYHAGDTDATDEMKALINISVAFVPVGGKYTMNAVEAASAVDLFRPGIAIPMHYGEIVGTMKDAEEFKKLAKTRVEILKKEM